MTSDPSFESPQPADQALAGVRVIDCSAALPGSFCTSLLQQFGADVTVLAEPDRATRRRSLFRDEHLSRSPVYHPYLSRGKAVLSADLASAEGVDELYRCLQRADVVVEDWRLGLFEETGIHRAELLRGNPGLVIVSVTPYGRNALRHESPASDLTLFHGGGPGHATPGLVRDPYTMPPLRTGSHQGEYVSGLSAAINVCAAIVLRNRSGSNVPIRVDFSCHEAMANLVRQNVGTYAFYGGAMTRDLARGRGAGGTAEHRNIHCKDGWINMVWAGPQHWDSVGELLERPAWMEDERLSSPGLRYKNWALVLPHLEEWAQQYNKEELFYILQGNRIPSAPVNDGPDLLDAAVLDSRAYWDRESCGAERPIPGRISRLETGSETTDVGLAEVPEGLPLDGIRVLDFTQFVSGPHCSLWLASLGAEVIKIESPNRPDSFRVSLLKRDVVPTRNNSPVFATTNLMKRGCGIDISTPEGQELCHRLVEVSDVVVANFRPGVLEQFNLGHSTLSKINPAVIVAAITGYGYSGDLAAFQALGPTIHAFTALSSVTGYPGGPPEPMFGTYTDVLTGQAAALAILTALIGRGTTGHGCFIDTAMSEAVISVAPEAALRASLLGERTPPKGNEEEGYAPHGCYPCEGDDRWVAIATFDEEDWTSLTGELGLEGCRTDERFSSRGSRWTNRDELDGIIAAATRSRDAFRLADSLQEAGVAAAPVRTAADLLEDEQFLADGFVGTVVHSELGPASLPKLPWRLSTIEDARRPIGPAPDFGEGTRELLEGILGIEASVWDDLRERGIVE